MYLLKPLRKLNGLLVGMLIFFFAFDYINACTTFVINDSTNLLFCRNYDFDFGAGFIVINKRGVAKQAMVFTPHTPAKWISKYGSITFNQIGIDAPMGGINEKGLVISQMALPESSYPPYEKGKVLNQIEWIQYQLDNSASLADVIKISKDILIVPIATPVHYFICDSLGNMGVFEFLNGELIIHQGKELTIPVCSNMIYDQSLNAMKKYKGHGGTKVVPQKWNSISDIIAIADSRIIDYKKSKEKNPINYCFKTLAIVGSPERTQWSVVYDIKNMKIHFKSLGTKETRSINFHNFDYSCNNDDIKILEIQSSNNSISLESQFFGMTKDYYANYKKNLINWFKANIKGFPDIPSEAIEYEVEYLFNRECRK